MRELAHSLFGSLVVLTRSADGALTVVGSELGVQSSGLGRALVASEVPASAKAWILVEAAAVEAYVKSLDAGVVRTER